MANFKKIFQAMEISATEVKLLQKKKLLLE